MLIISLSVTGINMETHMGVTMATDVHVENISGAVIPKILSQQGVRVSVCC